MTMTDKDIYRKKRPNVLVSKKRKKKRASNRSQVHHQLQQSPRGFRSLSVNPVVLLFINVAESSTDMFRHGVTPSDLAGGLAKQVIPQIVHLQGLEIRVAGEAATTVSHFLAELP
jgi:hypothetical protein